MVLYDSSGQFVGVRRPGSNRPIVVDGQKIIVDDVIGSSGLELKVRTQVNVLIANCLLSCDSHVYVTCFPCCAVL